MESGLGGRLYAFLEWSQQNYLSDARTNVQIPTPAYVFVEKQAVFNISNLLRTVRFLFSD